MAKPAIADSVPYIVCASTTREGYLRVVTVTLGHDVMDSSDQARVDLADHPLYKDLQRYVLANPR